jgi:hypothetical protein
MTRRLLISGVFALCLALIGFGAVSAAGITQAPAAKQAAASAKQTVADSSQAAREVGGSDPNVKTEPGPNDKAAKEKQAPVAKGGEKPRGTPQLIPCSVKFDNYTPWFVEAYVDGRYWGVIPPWGDIDTLAEPGPTVLYAKARFRDGTYRYWGPRRISCPDGDELVWRLDR